ncbi:MAG: protein kinase, partial [Longimicrobiales bacterium]|nr:protein kinase [Longimicrobiales bacterium]
IEHALRITREVADALGHAHAQGIVHRDIKPENVLLQGGHALVADFGIALAVQSAGGARLTQTGLSLGTPQYMSPEQAMGERTVDARADVYALGAVLYEMLTGEPPFTGATVAAVVAKVLGTEPTPPTSVRKTVPAHVEAAVLRALAKLPADRFAGAREFAEGLTEQGPWATAAAGQAGARPRPLGAGAWRARALDPLVLVPVAVALISVAALAVVLRQRPSLEPGLPVRFVLSVPDSAPVLNQFPWPAAISPDGSAVIYVAQRPSDTQFYLHRTDALEAYPIPGTESATQPVFSPDGAWVAFEASADDATGGGGLRKVRLDGSGMTTLANARANNGADWTVRDEIIVGSEGAGLRGLLRVSAAGGQLKAITHPDTANGEQDHLWPIAFEDGRTVAFVIWHGSLGSSELALTSLDDGRIEKLDLKGIRTLAVLDDELVYLQADGVVMSVRVDDRAMRATSAPTPVLDGITVMASMNGNSGIFVSSGGALVQTARPRGRLIFREKGEVDRPLSNDVRAFARPQMSPDGRRVAVQGGDGARTDIWLYDVATGASFRLTSSGRAISPAWSPDGLDVLFVAPTEGNRSALWKRRADGSGDATKLFETSNLILQVAMPEDGRTIILEVVHENDNDIVVIEPGAGESVRGYADSPALETQPEISPDGHALAYVSDESGRWEVYVDAYPRPGARLQVSANGGRNPRWSADGKWIYYLEGPRLIAATVSPAPDMRVVDRTVIDVEVREGFDVAGDGARFLTVETSSSGGQLIVTTNWLSELRQRIAPSRGR